MSTELLRKYANIVAEGETTPEALLESAERALGTLSNKVKAKKLLDANSAFNLIWAIAVAKRAAESGKADASLKSRLDRVEDGAEGPGADSLMVWAGSQGRVDDSVRTSVQQAVEQYKQGNVAPLAQMLNKLQLGLTKAKSMITRPAAEKQPAQDLDFTAWFTK